MARGKRPSKPAPEHRTAAEPAKRARTKWWQRLLLVGFSLLLLVLVEMLLRGFGYGPDLSLMVTRAELDDARIMGLNPLAWQRFALRPIRLRPGEGRLKPYEFYEPKQSGVFRIFFLGGSSVQGIPYGRNANMCAFLEVLLQAAWPDVRVEAVNCGVTAVNSYSLRAWLPELLGYEPDLLIVYAGHNEFYGFYGPGSLYGVGTNRTAILAHMWLRELRLGQVIRDVIGAFRSPPPQSAGTLMEMMAKDQLIRLDGPTYTACRENFRANLDDIIRAAQDAGVPIVLCGLISNERDLVPMVSAHREDLDPQQLKQWQNHFDEAAKLIASQRWQEALAALQRAAQIDDTYAELIYRMAQCRERTGRIAEALALYRRARDLDALRFRATGEFSRIIQRLAEERAAFVDTPAAFEAASPNGMIGWNLMMDHLHPTARGHYLIARAIYESLSANSKALSLPPTRVAAMISFQEAAEQLGCDEVTELVASLYILKLMDAYPFAGSPNAAHAEALLAQTARQVQSLPPHVTRAIDRWVKSGTTRSFHFDVAKEYLAVGDRERALVYLRRADRAVEPHSLEAVEIKLAMAQCLLPQDDEKMPDSTRRYLQETLKYARESAQIHPDQQASLSALTAKIQQMLR